jgi:hypothetical protein
MEMRKRISFAGIVGVMMVIGLFFTGCFSTPEAQPTPQPAAQPGQYGMVTFANKTGETIFFLLISESESEEWGDDWLGNNVIANGGSYTTRLLYGEYDVMAVNENKTNIYYFGLRVSRDQISIPIEPSDLIQR